MNKPALLLIAGLLLSTLPAQEGTWTRRADMPVDLWRAATFVIDGIGYVGTGAYDTEWTNRFWTYDPAADVWDTIPPLPDTGSDDNSGFVIDGRGYIGGGASDKHFWRYDPATQTWTQLPDLPLLSIKFERTLGFSCGQKGFFMVLSGDRDLYEYDPLTNNWTQRANYPGVVSRSAIAVSTDSLGFVGVGFGYDPQTEPPGNTHEWYAYDPRLDEWVQKADFPGISRNDAIAFATDSVVYVGMGISPGPVFPTDFWAYHISSDTWTQVASYPDGLGIDIGFAFAIDGKGYVGTGQARYFYEFNPLLSATRERKPRADALRIFPNPSTGAVTIRLDGELPADELILELFDARGSQVHRERRMPAAGAGATCCG
jgi:N-acetylneuraminic acid mutarotase